MSAGDDGTPLPEDSPGSFSEDEGLSEGLDDLQNIDQEQLSSVSVSGTDWTVGTIYEQIKKGNILLDPYFQRRDAWSAGRKSQYVESLLLGIPVPQIVLGEVPGNRGKFVVIDGKQRLLTIVQFYASTQPFDKRYKVLRLKELPILRDLNGKTKANIEKNPAQSDLINAFENQDIRTNIVRHLKSDEILYQIFLRLNTGSVKLSPQELRRALTPGEFWSEVDDMAEKSGALNHIFKGRIPDFRMRDIELLLRFVAFRRFIGDYDGNMKHFLDRVAAYFSKDWDTRGAEFRNLGEQMESSVRCTLEIFGDDAFKKFKGGSFEPRFNRAVFDVMTYYFSDADIRNAALAHRSEVKTAFQDICAQDEQFLSSLESTTKSLGATRYRLHAWALSLARAAGLAIDPAARHVRERRQSELLRRVNLR